MKRLLTTLLSLVFVLGMTAKPDVSTDKRYHIVCQLYQDGCVVDGASAGQNTPLYHVLSETTQTYSYWYFTEQEDGSYSIRNAQTGQYIVYDGVREDPADNGQLRRYVSLTDNADGNEALWNIVNIADGIYAFRNVAYPNHLWDVRTDSYCVGTYSRTDSPNNNQRFIIYDQDGNMVTEKTPYVEPDGFDVSSWLMGDPETMEGWNVSGGWFQNTGAGGSHYNYNDGSSLVAPFVENWHESYYGGLEDCSLTQELTTLPAGSYTLQADMMAVRQKYYDYWDNEPGQGVTLFANDSYTDVSTGNDPPQRFTVNFSLSTTGTVNLGVKVVSTNANWIAIDNVTLYYNETYEQLIEGEKAKVRAELADYYTNDQIEGMIGEAGDNFEALEQLRKSISNLPIIDPLSRAIEGLLIDGHAPVYVESLDLYLCSMPLQNFNTNYTAAIDYTPREGCGNLTINYREVTPGSQYIFQSVSANKTYTFSVKKADGTTVTKNVTFTSLPIVRIYGSFDNSYSAGSIAVTEPNKAAPDLLNMKAKWRGGITNGSGKHKRNYHVKLLDENGEKLEQKFFGLRNDNSWILESCQVDMSRIRNRVLTDLWNDYSTPPYYISKESKAKTGTRGKFVELLLNDEYRGIYCMTENIDRKQMKLMKYDEETGTVHGQLWKSKDWTYATMMGTSPDGSYQPKYYLTDPNEYNEMWDQYQVKYPDIDDVFPTDWSTLYEAVDFVCHSSDDEFREHIGEYFDLPLVIDYYILMETILATDNHGKNMFFGVYDKQTDKKITFSVWDMDATCGQRWSDDYYHWSGMQPEQDYAEFISRYEHGDYNLFKRLRDTDASDFNQKVRMRYRDLRGNFLATESILQRFSKYLDEFKTCGADQREYNKWNGDTDISRRNLDFDNEMEYITDWFTRRMNYLDTQRFDIASLPTDIASVQTKNAGPQTVYTLSGMKVGPVSQFSKLPSGIYIIGGRKVVKE